MDGRILLDIPCKVCRDHSSGKHYGIFACDGCAGFFKRSIRRNRQYVCKAKGEGLCLVDKTHRNQCRACRLKKCLEAGMNREAVQHERGPRNSTIRRQMSLFFKDSPPDSTTPPAGLGGPRGVHGGGGMSLSPAGCTVMTTVPLLPPIFTTASPTALSPSTSGLFSLPRPSPFLCIPTPKIWKKMFTRILYDLCCSGYQYPNQLLAEFVDNPEVICESAARLLFMNVRWAKTLPAFTALPLKDQLLLVEEGWRELWVLSAAQFLPPFEVGPLLKHAGLELPSDGEENPRTNAVLTEIRTLHDIIAQFKAMAVDPTEFACLKAIILFKTVHVVVWDGRVVFESGSGELRGLRDTGTVRMLQDQAQMMLGKYIGHAYPMQPFRFGKLLLLLPTFKSITARTVEDLFFKKTIGNIPLDRLISDMYKSNEF
ncbi:unnamed protein product [Darwinula stevensoni]|uniref:Nuclear receptor subfamily 2 group E member 1 n=1 Tax=Darwinula stevensoni TaxID=69355 RepID=A0A7R9FPA0_9CRUS|nr:unnamed protein product [Darwinula stevensoni]CAG0897734.1 unnamed protein product [Darwinula stevensoni]